MKKWSQIAAISALSSLFLFNPFSNQVDASTTIPIQMNGQISGVSGIVVDGHTLLPLRDVTAILGGQIGWNQADRSVTLNKGDKQIHVRIDSSKASINDHDVTLDAEPVIINDRTYVPLRFLSESLGYLVTYRPNPPIVSIQEVTQNPIVIQTVKLKKETDEFIVDMQFPQISGLENKEIEQRINSVLRGTVHSADEVFTAEDLQNLKHDREYLPSIKYGSYRNYKIKYNQNNIVSIVFNDSVYTGGAHESISQTAYTFHLKEGKQYQLSDLFTNGTDYQTLISEDIKKAVRNGDPYSFDPAFNAIDSETQNFYLDYDGKLVIYFDTYEYTPFAAGIPEFRVDVKTNL